MSAMKAVVIRIVLGVVALWVVVELLSWSESEKKTSVGFYLPYELFYYTEGNETEATATKFEVHARPTSALRAEGLRDCIVRLSKQNYRALSQQASHSDNADVRYLLVAVYWDKLTRQPVCDTGYDNVTLVEQKAASSFEQANKVLMSKLVASRL